MSVTVPPIKSQGIKTKLVPWISQLLKRSGVFPVRWVEPFMGTCAVAMNIEAREYILADINPHLVNFYNSLRCGEISAEMAKNYLLEANEKLKNLGEEYFYRIRDRFNREGDPLDFLFLSRACFNGMIRFNKSGQFNVPFCKKPDRFRPGYITKVFNQLKMAADFFRLNKVTVIHSDFRKMLSDLKQTDFVYCDPPYIDRYRDYYNGWTDKDEHALFDILSGAKFKFILSTWHHNCYRKNMYIDSMWKKFNVFTVDHFYHVGASEANRHPMTEAIVTNVDIIEASSVAGISEESLAKRVQLSLV